MKTTNTIKTTNAIETTEVKRIPAISVETTFATRQGLILDSYEGAEKAILDLTFSNGNTLQLSTDSVHSLLIMAAAHGLKQKLVDAAAISRNPDTGKSATIEDKYNAVKEVLERLLSGKWNIGRGEGSGGSGGLLFRALCLMYPAKTPEDVKQFLDGKSGEEKAALRGNPKVAAIIDTLRAKDSAVDSDKLLAGLEV